MINFLKHRKFHGNTSTWVVEWKTYKDSFAGINYPNVKTMQKVFDDKEEAYKFASDITNAMRLIGITALPYVKIHKPKEGETVEFYCF